MPIKTAARNLQSPQQPHPLLYNDINCYLHPKKLQPRQGTNLCAANSDEEGVGLITMMELQEDQIEKYTVRKVGMRSMQVDCSDVEDRKKPLSLGISIPQTKLKSKHAEFRGERLGVEREGTGGAAPPPNKILFSQTLRERGYDFKIVGFVRVLIFHGLLYTV
ncbi:hypothetical protein RHMOL_Rhmol09G0137000 [Rhododendron molle]|uniref:Uncharacterized protein n=1 Tax=Rhododendron molle TaxID=49168 RepID=A0ACC0MCW6_RHOML|nr:hypothetical protein RHMOL_Rhmol09G0137000 [Rhododendron molle]